MGLVSRNYSTERLARRVAVHQNRILCDVACVPGRSVICRL